MRQVSQTIVQVIGQVNGFDAELDNALATDPTDSTAVTNLVRRNPQNGTEIKIINDDRISMTSKLYH